MPDNENVAEVMAIVDKHAIKAAESEYDRTVSILAIGSARRTIENLELKTSDRSSHIQEILNALTELQSTYNDPDGIYTNGKGVIGSLVAEIAYEFTGNRSG